MEISEPSIKQIGFVRGWRYKGRWSYRSPNSAYFEHHPSGETGGLVAFEDYTAGFRERHAGLDGALVDGHLAEDFAVGIVFGF